MNNNFLQENLKHKYLFKIFFKSEEKKFEGIDYLVQMPNSKTYSFLYIITLIPIIPYLVLMQLGLYKFFSFVGIIVAVLVLFGLFLVMILPKMNSPYHYPNRRLIIKGKFGNPDEMWFEKFNNQINLNDKNWVIAFVKRNSKLKIYLRIALMFVLMCFVIIVILFNKGIIESEGFIRKASILFSLITGLLMYFIKSAIKSEKMNNKDILNVDDPKTYENKIIVIKGKEIWMEK
jgi:hypothetical protein